MAESVILFPTQGQGFGFAKSYETVPEGYDRTINTTVRSGGKAFGPSFAAEVIAGLASVEAPVAAVPWEDASGNPTVVILRGKSVSLFSNQQVTSESISPVVDTAARFASGRLFDDGSGTAQLYAGTKTSSKFLRRRTAAGVWSESAYPALYLAVAAGSLIRSVNDYQVKKWVSGDPMTGTWGASYSVGSNGAAITSGAGLGPFDIWGKEDGVWAYFESLDRYERIVEAPRDPLNFPFMESDGRGGLITAKADGTLVRITRNGAGLAANVLTGKYPGRDTPRGRIVFATPFGDDIYLVQAPHGRLVQPDQLSVVYYDSPGGTYTDYSEQARDGDFSTVVSMANFGTADILYIGAPYPFAAMELIMLAVNTTAKPMTLHRVGTAGALTAVLAYFNGTDTVPDTATPFGQSGIVAPDVRSLLDSWVTANVGSLGYSNYWLALRVLA